MKRAEAYFWTSHLVEDKFDEAELCIVKAANVSGPANQEKLNLHQPSLNVQEFSL